MLTLRSILTVLVLLLVPVSLAAQEAPDAAKQADRQAKQAEKQAKQRQTLIEKIWWNQEKKVQELKLSPEQRAAMNALLEGYLETQAASGKTNRSALDNFGSALAKGDLDAARGHRDDAVGAVADPVRHQLDMMIAVVELMTPAQRKTFSEKYPRMLSRLWVRTSSLRAMRGGRGGRGQ